MLKQAAFIITISIFLGGIRQLIPGGIGWAGNWPKKGTSSLDAYNILARADDPAFIDLTDVVKHQQNKDAVILDARGRELFLAGRIPGSRNLPYYEIANYQDEALWDLKPGDLVIIYCEGIGCELSFFLGRELQDAGYTNVRIFYGGYPEWKQAGLPIEK